ncbi:MAG: glutathione S-transferase N-terminal domain-containing protein [Erysipelotrichaceae bacterium]|nr:glutathione S-transferase N-terminal domain-containing protein [Erysipelotrichaceae bacterium]
MKLELYHMEYCPFCKKVFREIEQSGRSDIEYRDILKDKDNYRRLMDIGGLDQVPCLFIDGKPLYESNDIIQWLRRHPQE